MAGAAPQKSVGPLSRRPAGASRYSDLEHRLLRLSGQAIGDFDLIRPGDRVLVALSGGPASTALCALLEHHRRRSHGRFELFPLHLAERKARVEPLGRLLESWGLELRVAPWQPAPGRPRQGARAATERCRRRGFALRAQARHRECNKLADGLLLDDFLERLLDGMLRQGRIGSLAVTKTGADGISVIRPLVYVKRQEAAAYAEQLGLPDGLDTPRPRDIGLDGARQLIEKLEEQIPRLKDTMLGALGNVRRSHLLHRRRQT